MKIAKNICELGGTMAPRDSIVSFLDSFLKAKEIRDHSQNGLQTEGSAEVARIALGVSASLEFLKNAALLKAEMALVHHGLLWGRSQVYRGPYKSKIKLLMDSDMSLLAYHLPLDLHPAVGNNAQILGCLGAKSLQPFAEYDGQTIGFRGSLPCTVSLRKVSSILRKKLGSSCISFPFGPSKIRTIGVVSGGAADLLPQAVDAGLDLYITGDVKESTQEACREAGINFISAGHYNSEKAGVKALAPLLERKFKVRTFFIDIPNPV
ncbi:MAG: Nif3-like dinuclear metal center hexameric protein [bacterium]